MMTMKVKRRISDAHPRILPGDVDEHGADCSPQYVNGDDAQLYVEDGRLLFSERPVPSNSVPAYRNNINKNLNLELKLN